MFFLVNNEDLQLRFNGSKFDSFQDQSNKKWYYIKYFTSLETNEIHTTRYQWNLFNLKKILGVLLTLVCILGNTNSRYQIALMQIMHFFILHFIFFIYFFFWTNFNYSLR